MKNNGWVKVKIKPKRYDDYLTFDEHRVFQICHYNEKGWHNKNGIIEYWRELPLAPSFEEFIIEKEK